MANIPASGATRLNYHDGMFLTSQLMTTEQNYFLTQLALQNQLLYTPGVLDGLEPSLQNNNVQVTSGVGLTADGNLCMLSDANNVISVPGSLTTPCYVYLEYPIPVQSQTKDTVNMMATLTVTDTPLSGNNNIKIADVTHSNGTISKVTDVREGVNSKLPITLATLSNEPNDTLRGVENIATSALATVGKTASITLSYLVPKAAAFASIPTVEVSPKFSDAILKSSVSCTATKVDESSFEVNIKTINALPKSVTSFSLHWVASTQGG